MEYHMRFSYFKTILLTNARAYEVEKDITRKATNKNWLVSCTKQITEERCLQSEQAVTEKHQRPTALFVLIWICAKM